MLADLEAFYFKSVSIIFITTRTKRTHKTPSNFKTVDVIGKGISVNATNGSNNANGATLYPIATKHSVHVRWLPNK